MFQRTVSWKSLLGDIPNRFLWGRVVKANLSTLHVISLILEKKNSYIIPRVVIWDIICSNALNNSSARQTALAIAVLDK